jgi:colicin import membrane protein
MASSFVKEYSGGLTVSVVGHGALFLLLGLNMILMPETAMQPVQLAIEATVIDIGAIQRRQQEDQRLLQEERQRQQELERQRQQVETERRQQEEAQRREVEQTRIAEQRNKEEAEQTRQDAERKQREADRQKAEQQRRQQEEARAAEQRKKAEAEQKRQEAEKARQQAQMQAEMQSGLEAEERRMAAVNSGKLAQYLGKIRNHVERHWTRPTSARPGVECEVVVRQLPGGDVASVRVAECNGDAAVVRSIEAAVRTASPLPQPLDGSLFDQNLRFTFKPEE